jgi:hypothetical protein
MSKERCPLDVYFEEKDFKRATDFWGDTGTVIGYSREIILPCPMGDFKSVGGWWLFKRDRDGSVGGVHPKKIIFNET